MRNGGGLFQNLGPNSPVPPTNGEFRMATVKFLGEPYLSPADVAKRYGISVNKVLGWIRRGELHAVNLANRVGGRPRWKIAPEALADFERSRSATPSPVSGRRQRRPADAGILHFFR